MITLMLQLVSRIIYCDTVCSQVYPAKPSTRRILLVYYKRRLILHKCVTKSAS
jgi:hypothetical protein